jgi:hypothetical protein
MWRRRDVGACFGEQRGARLHLWHLPAQCRTRRRQMNEASLTGRQANADECARISSATDCRRSPSPPNVMHRARSFRVSI